MSTPEPWGSRSRVPNNQETLTEGPFPDISLGNSSTGIALDTFPLSSFIVIHTDTTKY